METGASITAAMFAAYLKCRTKAYLTARREKPPDPVFTEMRKRVSGASKITSPVRPQGGCGYRFLCVLWKISPAIQFGPVSKPDHVVYCE